MTQTPNRQFGCSERWSGGQRCNSRWGLPSLTPPAIASVPWAVPDGKQGSRLTEGKVAVSLGRAISIFTLTLLILPLALAPDRMANGRFSCAGMQNKCLLKGNHCSFANFCTIFFKCPGSAFKCRHHSTREFFFLQNSGVEALKEMQTCGALKKQLCKKKTLDNYGGSALKETCPAHYCN